MKEAQVHITPSPEYKNPLSGYIRYDLNLHNTEYVNLVRHLDSINLVEGPSGITEIRNEVLDQVRNPNNISWAAYLHSEWENLPIILSLISGRINDKDKTEFNITCFTANMKSMKNKDVHSFIESFSRKVKAKGCTKITYQVSACHETDLDPLMQGFTKKYSETETEKKWVTYEKQIHQ